MKDQVLSIEQMKVLGSLDIDISTKEEYLNWCRWNIGTNKNGEILSLGVSGYGICRAFTFQDVINLLPRCIDDYSLIFDIDACNISYLHYGISIDVLCQECGETILDTAYKMLVWVLKNK